MSQSRSLIVDLLRHGEPEWGDILRGRLDSVLSEFGWRHMRV
ncbi:MAG: histidine phosphatase family protein, partial [Pseudomonadota bacterium]|nr:histidine phosphatase family protein [Pseudomonadota bacterium]